MANPLEIATVTSNGQDYNIWTSIEAHAEYAQIMDHVILTVAEISTPTAQALSTLKLAPGDSASVSLGGVQIMNGYVYMRQTHPRPSAAWLAIAPARFFEVGVGYGPVFGKGALRDPAQGRRQRGDQQDRCGHTGID
jgi:hypothetical protein